jgi:fucose permease
MALVTFPAMSTILTSRAYYRLSHAQYGVVFAPQVVCAIVASLLAAELMRRIGTKRIYLYGLIADSISMALFYGSSFVLAERTLAYVALLLATASLGAGFGLAVPALNTLVSKLFPRNTDRAILMLNALLGVGTVLAPALSALFIGLHVWSLLPLSALVALVVSTTVSIRIPLADSPSATSRSAGALPPRFWLYAAAALLYGIIETMNGNWAEIMMTRSVGATAALASVALTGFWAGVTGGRLFFATLERRLADRYTFRFLPFLCAGALTLVARLGPREEALGIFAFVVAGVGCSALLPLTISFSQEEFARIGAVVAGLLIAFYQVGYGIAAFGAGTLHQDTHASLSVIFAAAALVAVALGLLATFAIRGPKEQTAPEQSSASTP